MVSAPNAAVADTSELFDVTDHGEPEQDAKDKWPQPSTFTETQKRDLQTALRIADQVAKDPLFTQVIQELADNNHLDWGTARLSSLPSTERAQPTRYILRRFEQSGQFSFSDLKPGLWGGNSSTTGSSYCNKPTTLNTKLLSRSTCSLVGTVLHERIHHFCQKHRYNKRALDKCDLAYQAGDLTIVLNAYRKNGSQPLRGSAPVLGPYSSPEKNQRHQMMRVCCI